MKKTILYVEDNIFSVSLMRLCLQKRPDFDLIIAPDGQTAWDKIFIHEPALILMDINLPDIDGWELTRRLRGHHLTCDIPIIAVTSLNRDRSYHESKDAGINLHLSKSMIHTALIPNMEALLSGSIA